MQAASGRPAGTRTSMTRQLSDTTTPLARSSSSSGPAAAAAGTAQSARVRFLTDPSGLEAQAAAPAALDALDAADAGSPLPSPREGAAVSGEGAERTITVVPQHRRSSSQVGAAVRQE